MSSGGLFTLVANDGVADKLIMGTDILKSRLETLNNESTPGKPVKLTDIMRTHNLFVYSTYRPFVPFGFEYSRTESQQNVNSITTAGSADTTVSFLISQQSDFVSDCAVNVNIGEIHDTGSYRLKQSTLLEPTIVISSPSLSAPLTMKFSAVSNVEKHNFLAVCLDFVKAEQLIVRGQDPVTGVVTVLTPFITNELTSARSIRAALSTGAVDGDVVFDGTLVTPPTFAGVPLSFDTKSASMKLSFTSAVLDSEGEVIPTGASLSSAIQRPWLKYCDFPGHRLVKNAQISIASNILDEYTTHVYNFYEKCMLSPGKREAYSRMIGHELPKDVSSSVNSGLMKVEQYADSLQAPRAGVLPATEMWIPLMFWFRDIERALPVASMPFAERKITLTLNNLNNLVYTVAPSSAAVHNIERTFTVGVAPVELMKVRSLKMTDYDGTANIANVNNSIGARFALYLQHIYLTDDVSELFLNRTQYSLIRCNRIHRTTLTNGTSSIQPNELRWPTEYMVIGAVPTYADRSAEDTLWHRYQYCQYKDIVEREMRGAGEGVIKTVRKKLECRDIITKMSLTTHGSTLVSDNIPVSFFSSAIQHTMGGHLHANRDAGLLYVPFCVKPEDMSNPSGHLNLTRLRETFLNITADLTNPQAPGTHFTADLVIMARALNLLTVANGSAILRYTN